MMTIATITTADDYGNDDDDDDDFNDHDARLH